MQKPMNPSKEKKHMKQMSIPLGSPAIAPARSLVASRDLVTLVVICFVINGIRKNHKLGTTDALRGRHASRRVSEGDAACLNSGPHPCSPREVGWPWCPAEP